MAHSHYSNNRTATSLQLQKMSICPVIIFILFYFFAVGHRLQAVLVTNWSPRIQVFNIFNLRVTTLDHMATAHVTRWDAACLQNN